MAEYMDELAKMSAVDLDKEYEKASEGIKNTKSDFFYWSWQAQLDAIELAKSKLMKKQIKWLCNQYGFNAVTKYISELEEVTKKLAEIDKLQTEVAGRE